MSEREQARDKVIAKACKWADSRKAKAAAPPDQKSAAQTKHRQNEHELAEAVEKFQKTTDHR